MKSVYKRAYLITPEQSISVYNIYRHTITLGYWKLSALHFKYRNCSWRMWDSM